MKDFFKKGVKRVCGGGGGRETEGKDKKNDWGYYLASAFPFGNFKEIFVVAPTSFAASNGSIETSP